MLGDSESGWAIYPFKEAFSSEENSKVSTTFPEVLSETTELQEARLKHNNMYKMFWILIKTVDK